MKKGIALIQVLASITILSLLLTSMIMSSQLTAIRISLESDKVQARENAKAGFNLSMLRLKIFQEVLNSDQVTRNEVINYISNLWEFPITIPLTNGDLLGGLVEESMKIFNSRIILTGNVNTSINTVNQLSLNVFRKVVLRDQFAKEKTLPFVKKIYIDYLESLKKEVIEKNEKLKEVLEKVTFDDFIEDLVYYTAPINYKPEDAKVIDRFKSIDQKNAPLNSLSELLVLPSFPYEFLDQILQNFSVDILSTLNFNKLNKHMLFALFEVPLIQFQNIEIKIKDNVDNMSTRKEFKTFLSTILEKDINSPEFVKKMAQLFDAGFRFCAYPTLFKIISEGRKGKGRYVIEALVSIPSVKLGERDEEEYLPKDSDQNVYDIFNKKVDLEVKLEQKLFRFPRIVDIIIR